MARAMLEYTKTILDKVSFDVTLFCKEVQKAVKRLLPHELEELEANIVTRTRSKEPSSPETTNPILTRTQGKRESPAH